MCSALSSRTGLNFKEYHAKFRNSSIAKSVTKFFDVDSLIPHVLTCHAEAVHIDPFISLLMMQETTSAVQPAALKVIETSWLDFARRQFREHQIDSMQLSISSMRSKLSSLKTDLQRLSSQKPLSLKDIFGVDDGGDDED